MSCATASLRTRSHPSQPITALFAEESGHLVRVLRLGAGARVLVFDGRGTQYLARIATAAKDSVTLSLLDPAPPAAEPRVRLTLAQAVLKGDKMDAVVRDATMMGVSAVIPLITERTVVPRSAVELGRVRERWHRIAVSSAKQCGRAIVPEIGPPERLTRSSRHRSRRRAAAAAHRACGRGRDVCGARIGESDGSADAENRITARGTFRARDDRDRARRRMGAGRSGSGAGGRLAGWTVGARTLRAESAPLAALSILTYAWRLTDFASLIYGCTESQTLGQRPPFPRSEANVCASNEQTMPVSSPHTRSRRRRPAPRDSIAAHAGRRRGVRADRGAPKRYSWYRYSLRSISLKPRPAARRCASIAVADAHRRREHAFQTVVVASFNPEYTACARCIVLISDTATLAGSPVGAGATSTAAGLAAPPSSAGVAVNSPERLRERPRRLLDHHWQRARDEHGVAEGRRERQHEQQEPDDRRGLLVRAPRRQFRGVQRSRRAAREIQPPWTTRDRTRCRWRRWCRRGTRAAPARAAGAGRSARMGAASSCRTR